MYLTLQLVLCAAFQSFRQFHRPSAAYKWSSVLNSALCILIIVCYPAVDGMFAFFPVWMDFHFQEEAAADLCHKHIFPFVIQNFHTFYNPVTLITQNLLFFLNYIMV